MATTTITARSSTSLQVVVTGLDTAYSRADRYIDWYVGGSYHSRQPSSGYFNAYISQTSAFTLSGLSTNTSYTVTAVFFYTSGGVYYSTNLATITVPTTFLWTYAKTSGGDFNLTASEWNNFIANINYVRSFKGLFTIGYTTAVTGNTFTAAMYNQAQPAVNGLYSYMTATGQNYINATSEVSVGNIITANSINYLQYALNTVI